MKIARRGPFLCLWIIACSLLSFDIGMVLREATPSTSRLGIALACLAVLPLFVVGHVYLEMK